MFAHQDLILSLIKRDIAARYRGSTLGLGWAVFTPLLLLAVYTFVFSSVMRSRWPGLPDTPMQFAAVLFVGLSLHGLLAECMTRAPMLIVQNPNYVKKVVFPLHVLSYVALGSALIHYLIALCLLIPVLALLPTGLHLSALSLPLILLAFIPFLLGVVWVLSALGVYVRDLHQAVGLVAMMFLFLAPIFYTLETVPAQLSSWLALNPLTFIVESARNALVLGRWPDWLGLLTYAVTASCFAVVARAWFDHVKSGFADVL